mmetsp:Transcript_68874/g.211230  ORF Transcript_68874/g.211230 Transcript_68874/m.211230 type:complete len:217 (-) Transcript_68874:1700-2350(-)
MLAASAFHFSLFASAVGRQAWICSPPGPLEKLTMALKDSTQNMSMKNAWLLANPALVAVRRSHSGEIGSPSDRSSSPCSKNSIVALSDHSKCWSQGSRACPTSEALMSHSPASVTSSSNFPSTFLQSLPSSPARTRNSPSAMRDFSCASLVVWNFMSVLKMKRIMHCRKRLRTSAANSDSTSASPSIAAKLVAACMFSSTDASFHTRATGCSEFMR